MDEASAVRCCHKIAIEHSERARHVLEAREKRFVYPAFEVTAFEFGDNVVRLRLFVNGIKARFGDDVNLAVIFVTHGDVIEIRSRADSEVGG